jgi:hypothetical protein
MKATVKIDQDVKCDGCGGHMWYEQIGTRDTIYCSSPGCSNFGKHFAAPQIELEEIKDSTAG